MRRSGIATIVIVLTVAGCDVGSAGVDAQAADRAEARGRELMELTFQAEDAQDVRVASDAAAVRAKSARCADVLKEAKEANERQRMRLAKLTAGIDDDVPPPPSELLIAQLRVCVR